MSADKQPSPFSVAVRGHRERLDLTQPRMAERIARELGLKPDEFTWITWRSWEQNKRTPAPIFQVLLLRFLETLEKT